MNDQGRRYNEKKKFAKAAAKFQEALNKCPAGHAKRAIYQENLNLANAQQAKVEEARRLNDEGCRLHNEEKRFAEAAAKFQEAVNQCPEGHADMALYQIHLELAHLWHAQEQARLREEEQARQAQANMQEEQETATNLKRGATESELNLSDTKKARVEEEAPREKVIRLFKDILNNETEVKLQELKDSLAELDDTLKMDLEIGNITAVLELRLRRVDLQKDLDKGQVDLKKFKQDTSDLISGEIELLEKLLENQDIERAIREEIDRLRTQLEELEEELANMTHTPDVRVRIQEFAEVAIRKEEEIEKLEQQVHQGKQKASEKKLEGELHLEMGSAGTIREPLVAMILETYSMAGMDELLSLRLVSLQETIQRPVKILPSSAISFPSSELGSVNARNIFKQLAKENNVEEGITIIPLLIALPQVTGSYDLKHWVGLISEKCGDKITISYLDSENMSIEGFGESVIAAYQEIHPNSRIDFRQVSNEQQRYNNCGPELIENIALYLTGLRVEQEDAIYLHSALWEHELIWDEIKATKEVTKKSAVDKKALSQVYKGNGESNRNPLSYEEDKPLVEEGLQQKSTKESVEAIKVEAVPDIVTKSKIALPDTTVHVDIKQEYDKQTVKLQVGGIKESNSKEVSVKRVTESKSPYQGNEQVDIKQQANIKDVATELMEDIWQEDRESKHATGLNFIPKKEEKGTEREELDKKAEAAMNMAWEESEKLNGAGVSKEQASTNNRNPGVVESEWLA